MSLIPFTPFNISAFLFVRMSNGLLSLPVLVAVATVAGEGFRSLTRPLAITLSYSTLLS